MTALELSKEQVAAVLVTALQEVREKLDADMPVQQLLTLLIAARTPGITMKDAMTELNISSASISRNVSALSPMNRFQKPGYGLIVAREDPLERRRKLMELTPAGSQFAKHLAAVVTKKLAREARQ